MFALPNGFGRSWLDTYPGSGPHRFFHPETNLNVMKKSPGGTWRIQARMWDDGPERVN